jgi:hypothetical protein
LACVPFLHLHRRNEIGIVRGVWFETKSAMRPMTWRSASI